MIEMTHMLKRRLLIVCVVLVFVVDDLIRTNSSSKEHLRILSDLDKEPPPPCIAVPNLANISHDEVTTTTAPTTLPPTSTPSQQPQQPKDEFDWHGRTFDLPPRNREDRFPSMEERIRIYMSEWALPPCNSSLQIPFQYQPVGEVETINPVDNSTTKIVFQDVLLRQIGSGETQVFESTVKMDRIFAVEYQLMVDCMEKKKRVFDQRMELEEAGKGLLFNSRLNHVDFLDLPVLEYYCGDGIELPRIVRGIYNSTIRDVTDEETLATALETSQRPILVIFGDIETSLGIEPSAPYFAKFRFGRRRVSLSDATEESKCQPYTPLNSKRVIWMLNHIRHFAPAERTRQLDTPWSAKQDKAIFRGQVTGDRRFLHNATYENCQFNIRCRFVHNLRDSSIVDARFNGYARNYFDEELRSLTDTTYRPMEVQMQYKMLISLEGNDVSSGLKWMLASDSIVLMPPPRFTSWAMEEILEPWVHYLPIYEDGSNTEEMVRWVLDHDREARLIAERSKLFMMDIIDYPEEEESIKYEMVRRYQKWWRREE